MLISVHLPKTAGQSFKKSLSDHFGNSLRLDYGRPLFSPPFRRNLTAALGSAAVALRPFTGVRCIHGHFLPLKYAGLRLRGARFVTWMRDPVERLASQYHYWKRTAGSGATHPVQRRMVDEGWSLERFCLEPALRNLYGQFLWGFPFERFSFVGLTEHYEEDVRRFSELFLEGMVPAHAVNVNESRAGAYVDDRDLRRRIEAFHDQDVRLYRRAVEKRRARQDAVHV